MKKTLLFISLLASGATFAQDHFSGINTSRRVGMLNAQMNPAELANLRSKYEINLFAVSVNAANNKVNIEDLGDDETDFEQLLFSGDAPANLRVDAELFGPSGAYRMNKWAFGIFTKANGKMDLVDVDTQLGDAIANDLNLVGSTVISNQFNQRLTATTWGEVGFTVARNVFETSVHKINGGLTLKLLFPGSYANFGADRFSGTINNMVGSSSLTDATANLNIAYSGNLGESFKDFSDYSNSVFGSLNGFAADFGVNYQWKDVNTGEAKINAGLSIRNLGSMTFSDGNNSNTNYNLSVQGNESLNLNQFDDAESVEDIEEILLDSGFLNRTQNENTDFKVKLPTTFTAYADVKIVNGVFVTLFTKQKLAKDEENDQITSQNILSLTPRLYLKNFEIWSTWSDNEISGLSGGLGVRAYGFFIGSGSAITAIANNAQQADFYIGYSFGLK